MEQIDGARRHQDSEAIGVLFNVFLNFSLGGSRCKTEIT